MKIQNIPRLPVILNTKKIPFSVSSMTTKLTDVILPIVPPVVIIAGETVTPDTTTNTVVPLTVPAPETDRVIGVRTILLRLNRTTLKTGRTDPSAGSTPLFRRGTTLQLIQTVSACVPDHPPGVQNVTTVRSPSATLEVTASVSRRTHVPMTLSILKRKTNPQIGRSPSVPVPL